MKHTYLALLLSSVIGCTGEDNYYVVSLDHDETVSDSETEKEPEATQTQANEFSGEWKCSLIDDDATRWRINVRDDGVVDNLSRSYNQPDKLGAFQSTAKGFDVIWSSGHTSSFSQFGVDKIVDDNRSICGREFQNTQFRIVETPFGEADLTLPTYNENLLENDVTCSLNNFVNGNLVQTNSSVLISHRHNQYAIGLDVTYFDWSLIDGIYNGFPAMSQRWAEVTVYPGYHQYTFWDAYINGGNDFWMCIFHTGEDDPPGLVN